MFKTIFSTVLISCPGIAVCTSCNIVSSLTYQSFQEINAKHGICSLTIISKIFRLKILVSDATYSSENPNVGKRCVYNKGVAAILKLMASPFCELKKLNR